MSRRIHARTPGKSALEISNEALTWRAEQAKRYRDRQQNRAIVRAVLATVGVCILLFLGYLVGSGGL